MARKIKSLFSAGYDFTGNLNSNGLDADEKNVVLEKAKTERKKTNRSRAAQVDSSGIPTKMGQYYFLKILAINCLKSLIKYLDLLQKHFISSLSTAVC